MFGLLRAMVACLGLLLFATALGSAVHLPSVPAGDAQSRKVKESSAAWWAQVGEQYYYAPSGSSLLDGLSPNVSDYYYGVGSLAGARNELQNHRVGGNDRYHIFHLPGRTSFLQTQVMSTGDRRSSMSSLVQLAHGTVLGSFPHYQQTALYQDPFHDDIANQIKATADKVITTEAYKDVLSRVVGGGTRSYKNTTASHLTQSFLRDELKEMGLSSCLHRFTAEDTKLANVVALIPGTSHKLLTLGAHYDSRPFSGSAPGAEDNGSGVAALVLIAKALQAMKQKGIKPLHNIHIAFFAAEEAGLYGSAHFVDDLQGGHVFSKAANGSQEECAALPLRAEGTGSSALPLHQAIILDEIGWESPSTKNTVNLESVDKDGTKSIMDHLFEANKDANGEWKLTVVHSSKPFGSDHMSFLDKGLNAVLVINADDQAYPNYHQSTDSIENVKLPYAVSVTKMVFGAAARVSAATSAPPTSSSLTQKAAESAHVHRHGPLLVERAVTA